MVVEWAVKGWPHTSKCSEMNHGINSFVWKTGSPDVAAEEDTAIWKLIPWRKQVKADHPMANCGEVFYQMTADKSR